MNYSTFLAALLFPLASISQNVFKPGYVVQPSGDTLRGEVRTNEKKPLELYSKITFRDSSGMQKTLKPAKIKAFGVENDIFRAFGKGDEAAFYRVLAHGQLTLLETKYEGLRMNKPYVETEYFLVSAGDNTLQGVKEKNFRKQLQAEMKDNEEIANSYPEDKKFDIESAIQVITEYNTWKSEGGKQ